MKVAGFERDYLNDLRKAVMRRETRALRRACKDDSRLRALAFDVELELKFARQRAKTTEGYIRFEVPLTNETMLDNFRSLFDLVRDIM